MSAWRCAALPPKRKKPAAEHHRREIRLEHEAAAERLHDDHRLDRRAADPAVFFGEGQAEQAELGELRPALAAVALRLLAIGLAVLERVAVGDHPARRSLLQQPLLFAQIEIHGAQSPRMALAMMFFWISFEPP